MEDGLLLPRYDINNLVSSNKVKALTSRSESYETGGLFSKLQGEKIQGKYKILPTFFCYIWMLINQN